MTKKLFESIKLFTARNLVVLSNEQINKNLYPVNPMHTSERVSDVEARKVKPTGIVIRNIEKFRAENQSEHNQ